MSLAEKFRQFMDTPVEHYSGRDDNVLFIDGLNTYMRCFAATPTMDDDGTHVGGVTGFLMSMGAAIRQWKPTRCVIAFDGRGGSQRRRKLYPDYKGNRRSMQKLNRTYDFASLEDEKKAMVWQLKLLLTMLSHLPVTVLALDNVEADDVIAYLAQTVAERGGKSIIMSTDKDFLQLVSSSISVWNPIKKRLYNEELVVTDYGFHPKNFLLYRMVTGDDSDNIPGVKGVKEKTLLKYFPELACSEPRDASSLIEGAKTLTENTKKPTMALKHLVDATPQLELNYQLMRLDEVAMSGPSRIDALEKFDATTNPLQKFELTQLLTASKLIHVFSRYDQWIATTFVPLTRFGGV